MSMTNQIQNSLQVSLIQTRLSWHKPADNRAHFQEKIAAVGSQSDVCVLPETFTTGFTSSPQRCPEAMQGESMQWMADQAASWDTAICGSLALKVDQQDRFRNRFIWMNPDGSYAFYDKKHLFGLGGESKRYTPGHQRQIIEYRGWRINPQICYDLRFPVWCRNHQGFDLQIFVANWPQARKHAWRILLKARAIENQAYVVGVNRIGEDGNGLHYAGDSTACDFLGESLAELGLEDQSATVEFKYDELMDFRKAFDFQADADSFVLT